MPKTVRFHGIYQDVEGKPRGFDYRVVVSKRLLRNGSAMRHLIVTTIGEMKSGRMPLHKRGQVFTSFIYGLFGRDTPWIQIDTLLKNDTEVPS
jgi:hypothetical protein